MFRLWNFQVRHHYSKKVCDYLALAGQSAFGYLDLSNFFLTPEKTCHREMAVIIGFVDACHIVWVTRAFVSCNKKFLASDGVSHSMGDSCERKRVGIFME